MRLLLTSGGLRNDTLKKELLSLLDKPVDKVKIAFIPTAMNADPGDKGWAINQMQLLQGLGVEQLDIVDVSALNKDVWLPRLKESDVIFVNGGNTTHLMTCFNESGLTEEIPKLLESRVYIGVSAGSYIATPDVRFNSDNVDVVLDGLNLVSFGLQAHLYSPDFPIVETLEVTKKRVGGCPYTVYAIDDQMAVKVVNSDVEVVGEGEHERFDP